MTTPPPSPRQDGLHERTQALHVALIRQAGLEARIASGHLDRDLLDRSLRAAEAVIAARVALIRFLIEQGWTPPPMVVLDAEFDTLVLDQEHGRLT